MNLREILPAIIQGGLGAVDPQAAVNRKLVRQDQRFYCGRQAYDLNAYRRLRVVGFGKGSAPMAQAVYQLLSDRITDGLVIVKYGHTLPPQADLGPIRLVEAGHPVPDDNSLQHTTALMTFLANGQADDLVLCLISGGGSALLAQPVSGISLDHIQALTRQLLNAGADITEINTIRKHLSAIKGGQLARLAAPATIISLILSDVEGDRLDAIASGPTVPDPTTYGQALTLIDRYQLADRLPAPIIAHLQDGQAGRHPETPKPGDTLFEGVQNEIIANNTMAVEAATAAAIAAGLNASGFQTYLTGEAQTVAQQIGALALSLTHASDLIQKPTAFIFGGETTVTLDRHGLGGRNQELALALALKIRGQANLVIAAVATDGNDGPTDAAGAIVDGQTVARAAALGLDADHYLREHDSYHFFAALDDLIITGPTNTNVNDLLIIMAG